MPSPPDAAPRASLLLVFQLPAGRSSARVAVWRRLQRLGATSLGGAAYALPAGGEERESFEWLRQEIAGLGGRVELYEARALAPLAAPGPATLPARLDVRKFRGRTWVTRPRPGVDRMASAWLIRRFVDPRARFAFAERPPARLGRAVPFDMYGVELGHHGRRCTFEVLVERFGLDDPELARLGRLVRAVDLGEEAEDPPRAEMLERLVAGLRATHADDGELLASGMALFAALHAGELAARPAPRARPRTQLRRRGAGRPERRRKP